MCPNRAAWGNSGMLGSHSWVDAILVPFRIVTVTVLIASILLQTRDVVMM